MDKDLDIPHIKGKYKFRKKSLELFLENISKMILTWYEVNMTNNIPKISYVPNPLYFQNIQLIGKMQISRKAKFSDFSEKHSDIVQVLPYKNQK